MVEPDLTVHNLVVEYDQFTAVDNVNFEVYPGEILGLLGPSGSGKSTLLSAIAGLVEVSAGTIVLRGDEITHLAVHKREIGLVFQDGQLFPHLNVFDNIAYGLRIRKVASSAQQREVARLLELVDLVGFENRSIHTLSGGQAQRIALARALATKPKLMLLDEPLSALDHDLKQQLALELKQILHHQQVAALYVTHDRPEAQLVADRIARMQDGQLSVNR